MLSISRADHFIAACLLVVCCVAQRRGHSQSARRCYQDAKIIDHQFRAAALSSVFVVFSPAAALATDPAFNLLLLTSSCTSSTHNTQNKFL
jgi:hypothetical protein